MKEHIEAELARLEATGNLTPDAVIEAAVDPANPLHEEFEWDDTDAARKYRLQQARSLIRNVRVEVRTSTIVLNSTAYVHDPSRPDREGGYVAVSRIRSDTDRARQALLAEMGRVKSSADRAREIAVGVGLEAEVEQLLYEAIGARTPTRTRRA